MSFTYTNNHNLPLSLLVFLLHDDYEYDARSNSISATTLIRPIRQLVLAQQNKTLQKSVDVYDLVASRMGSAIHTMCETAWGTEKNITTACKILGMSDSVRKSLIINPETPDASRIPIYVEQRTEKEIGGYIVTGKFDLVLDGNLHDYKSGSVWGFIYDSNADQYAKQGSIYKWLNPDKITSEFTTINYIFTDWSASKAKQDKNHPQRRVTTKKYPLWSVEKTEEWIQNKLDLLTKLKHLPQSALPQCTDEELWATETVYKYFKNPDKMSRATKNFASMDEALIRKSADGDVGTIKVVPGEVKACRYCPVVDICNQANDLLTSGRLLL